jgi:hypothetical protein
MRRQPRLTHAINIKVRQIDYEQLERLAGDRSVTEWGRDILLRELAGPDPFQLALMEQFWALRYILLNGLPLLASDVLEATKTLRAFVEGADERKADRARALLVRR